MIETSARNRGEGRTVLVTGAGKGMGAAISRELATRGYSLALMGISDSVMVLAEELGGIGYVGSVTDNEALEGFVDAALAGYGRIDAVVSSTGHPPAGQLLTIPDEDWHAAFDLVVLNVIRLARLVTPTMLRQGGGVFINISSAYAVEPSLTFPVSSALRAALSGFTRLFAQEYGPVNVRMNCVLPGRVDSWPVTDEELNEIPMARLARVDEVAQLVAYLVSDEAAYITGQSLRIDGGLTKSL